MFRYPSVSPSRQRVHVEQPPVFRDGEAVRHAGDVIGDEAGPLRIAAAPFLDAPLGIVRQAAGGVEEERRTGP